MASNLRSHFMTKEIISDVLSIIPSPVYVYSHKLLKENAEAVLSFPNAFGLTARYAMKASPNAAILRLFNSLGLHFDASSGYEVHRAIKTGIPPSHISISSQELPHDFKEILSTGVKINCCSLHQLEQFGKAFPGKECGIRFNPGLGSGGTGKTNVGGPSASFGIWHEHIPKVLEIVEKYSLKIVRIHTHIGSGSDPLVWQKTSTLSVNILDHFPLATTLNLGGGFKIDRMLPPPSTEESAEFYKNYIRNIGEPVKKVFEDYFEKTSRKIHLEIEPGTFLVSLAGVLLTQVQDKVTTFSENNTEANREGFTFVKLNSGMTDILRPSLYAAQHPIIVFNDSNEQEEVVVVGHCCESGDLLTCSPNDSEEIAPRLLPRTSIGDVVVIEGCGAYCSSMSTKNYNSFPESAEVIIDLENKPHIIRKRQSLEQIIQNEVTYDF